LIKIESPQTYAGLRAFYQGDTRTWTGE